jgi:putative spermidine/putrescine transport system ATP-binding protein
MTEIVGAPPVSPVRVSASERSGTAVEFADVSRVFGGTRALDRLNLRIEPGELLALLGPSGCGKTTALRLLAGFDQPSSGTVLVDGKDVSRVPANRRDMGMVFQAYSLFPTMTALDNVAFGPRVRRQGKAGRLRRAGELLDLVGLAAHHLKYPHQLSGGQQQRVALARALAVAPRVLLLDEPLSALDAQVRLQLRDEIRRIQLDLGVTTVFVTHDQEEALSMSDRVAVMRAGRLEQCAAPIELYDRPSTAFVAEFVGTMNHLPGVTTDDGHVRVGEQILPVQGDTPTADTAVTVLARPESIVLTASGQGDAIVAVSTFHGATTRLRLLSSDSTEVLADLPSHRAAEFPPGTRVTLALVARPVLLAGRGQD